MPFHVQKRGQYEKNKSVKETRQPEMSTQKVTTMLSQNLDENANTQLEITENCSQKIWTKCLKD